MGRILGFVKLLLLGVFLILISCPITLEDNLSETIASEVHEATASEYSLTIETPENGVINLSGSLTVKDGISQQLVANPYQTHAFIRWEKVSGSGTVIFVSAESSETSFYVTGGDLEIRAVFEERPRIRYSTPTGTGVGIDASVLIKFSREMDANTINEDTVRLVKSDTDEPVSGIISYDNKMVTFKPSTDMESWTRFSIRVSRNVKDLNGISLSEDYVTPSPFETRATGDVKPPIDGTFKINGGETWASSTDLVFSDIFARDLDGGSIAKMYISEVSGDANWSDPLSYSNTANWTYTGGDGANKILYMKFEDASGNQNNKVSIDGSFVPAGDLITSTISIDTTAPVLENVQTTGEAGIAIAVTDDGNNIPDGDMYTASQDVDLYMNASDAGIGTSGTGGEETLQMILAQDLSFTQGEWNGSGYDSAIWENFTNETTPRHFKVDPGDGTKVVIVKFRDSLGNISDKTYDYVRLDQTPPTGTITINNGTGYTKESSVDLNISAVDNGVGTVSYMMISNSSDFSGAVWEPYSATKVWTIGNSADGEKTVYIKFKDLLDNETPNYVSDSVIVDATAPVSASIQINNGTSETNTAILNLSVSASDNTGGSGIYQMVFNFEDDFTDATWIPYSTTGSYTIPSAELPASGGSMSVYASFKDTAGNIIASSAVDDIIYDITPPDGTFTINGDADYTNNTGVTINSTFSGVSSMRFSNNNSTWTPWMAYNSSYSFTLASGDGNKTVYAQYSDRAYTNSPESGNVTNRTDTIILDTIIPSVVTCYLEGTADDNSTTRYSYVTIHSNVSGAPAFMRFKNESGGTWSGWYSYNPVKTGWYLNNYNVDGIKTVYFEYMDAAGNITGGAHNDTIIIDKTAPVVSYFRIGGSDNPAKTKYTTVTLYSNVSDANGVYQMNIGNYGSSWNGYETYNVVRTGWALKNPEADELKRIYCSYKDKAGNETSTSLYDTITLDTTPPQDVNIIINNGRTYAYDRSVQLSVSATDVPSGSQMRFYYIQSSGSYGYTTWENYGTSKTITLSDADGTKYVYVQFRDDLENTSPLDATGRDTIYLDRPSISYVTRGTPGYNGRVKVYLNTVYEDSAVGEDVLYYIYTSTTPTGTRSYRGYIYNSGDEVTPPAEETEYYFHVRIGHKYDGVWHALGTYYTGAGGISRTGFAADVIVVYDDDDSTDTTLANTIKATIQSANGGTVVSSRDWNNNIYKSVMLVPEDYISTTYSGENTVYGDPVIITPSADAIRTYAGKMRNISAHGRGVIAMGNDSWSLMQSISNNFSSWGYTGQQPYSLGTADTGTTTYPGPFYYRWNTTDFESPWKYPLYISTLGGENPTDNITTQITYYNPPSYPAWAISSKYISNDADPAGGKIYGRVYGSGNLHHFGIIRQGRFMVFAFDSMFTRTSGKVLFVNLVDTMNRNF